MTWAELETDLSEKPLFPVEAPDGKRELTEHARQSWFVSYMRKTQPHIEVHANMNHGARNQIKAKREGLMAGVFDMTVAWGIVDGDPRPTVAWPEFKGYDKNGTAGKLSQAQIDWGNAMHRKGFPVACFFSARSVIEWLRGLGAPIRGRVQ